MNLGDIDLHSVQYSRPRLQNSPSRQSISPPIANDRTENHEEEYASASESTETADTVIRWRSPQTPNHNPQPHQLLTPIQQPEYTHDPTNDIGAGSEASNDTLVPPPMATLDELQRKLVQSAGAVRVRMEDFRSGPPTPNTDDTPYIRFAIDQLTRDDDVRLNQRPLTGDSDESYPVERIVPDEGLGYMQSIKTVRRPSLVQIAPRGPGLPFQSALERASDYIAATTNKSELFIPINPEVNSPRHPNLTWKPRILGALSMGFLAVLCLLMIAALVACAVYSMNHDGVTTYNGRNFGGQYFLFQFFPQILAAVILFYIESVMRAVVRVVPYTMMASDDSRKRNSALFMGLYPRSLLLPKFEYFSSEPLLAVASMMFWPIMFTIPLHSCLFTVVLFDGSWRWTTVQGVAWTLVAIYVVALLSLIGILIFFFHRPTGLIWDPRSIADILALLPRSNSLDEYRDTEILASKGDLKATLGLTSERLGYWRTSDVTQDVFYCIGEEGSQTRRYTIQSGKAQEKTPIYNENHTPELADFSPPQPLLTRGTDSSLLAKVYSPAIRFRYIPWFLNDTFIILWPIAGFFILLALFVVSFLPSTAISDGFRPQVSATPNTAGFSAANFLYSFIPSLIGLLLYSTLAAMTQTLYRLTPWAGLSKPSGSIASETLLLDYTASSFFSNIPATFHNGHYLLGFLSIISPLAILLPILGGGLFMALISSQSREIRMLPNLPAFYIILTVLILYLIALISIAVSLLRSSRKHGARKLYNLPHSVTCLAEIISFLYASGLIHDAAFRAVRSKSDLRARLIGRRERISTTSDGFSGSLARGEEVRYYFGIFRGRDQRSHLGVERVGRAERDFAIGARGRDASMSRFSV